MENIPPQTSHISLKSSFSLTVIVLLTTIPFISLSNREIGGTLKKKSAFQCFEKDPKKFFLFKLNSKA